MERLGPYNVLGRIGTGGSADLLLALPVHAGPRVVLKKLHAHLADNEDYVRMFRAEARVMSLLRHQNVVRVVDDGAAVDDDGAIFFAMELVDGPNLAAVHRLLMARGDVCPPAVAVAVAARVAAGLDFVHRALDPTTGEPLSLVHRDVAPSNILVSRDGDVKLTDFGVVKLPRRGEGFLSSASTAGGVLKGHLATMSPEQLRGGVVDARTDLYALGVVLWEALAGRRMFEGTPLELVDRIVNEVPPALDGVDPDLAALVASMLAKDPAARPESAAVVRDALGALRPANAGEVANVIRSLKVPSLRA